MRLLPINDDATCQGCKHLQVNRYHEFVDYFCLRFRHPVGRRFYEMEKDKHHGWGTEPIEDHCWEEE